MDQVSHLNLYHHKEFLENKWKANGNISIKINLKEEKQITDILLYGNVEENRKPQIEKIKLSKDILFTDIDYDLPSLPGEAIIVSFEVVNTKEIIMEFKNKDEFSISEIIFMGY